MEQERKDIILAHKLYEQGQKRAHSREINQLKEELLEALLARCGPLGRTTLNNVPTIPSEMILCKRLETDDSGYRYTQTLSLDLRADTQEYYTLIVEKFLAGAKFVVDGVLYRLTSISVDHNTAQFGLRTFVNNPPTVTAVLEGIGGGEVAKEFS